MLQPVMYHMLLAQALGSTGALRGAHEPPTKKAFMGKGIGTSCVGMDHNLGAKLAPSKDWIVLTCRFEGL